MTQQDNEGTGQKLQLQRGGLGGRGCVLEWLSQSQDLNPSENPWLDLITAVRQHYPSNFRLWPLTIMKTCIWFSHIGQKLPQHR